MVQELEKSWEGWRGYKRGIVFLNSFSLTIDSTMLNKFLSLRNEDFEDTDTTQEEGARANSLKI